MIKGVVLHLNNEQPLTADIKTMPQTGDQCMLVTNLRHVDGKKPTFIDRVDSWFLIPMALVRFVEMPREAVEQAGEVDGVLALPPGPILRSAVEEDEEEASDELLRRIREA